MPRARTESRALSRTSDRAATQNSLGNVLREQGEWLNGAAGAANLSAAVVFGGALRVRTETYDPLSRALRRCDLANREETQAEREGCADPRGSLQAALDHAEAARVADGAA